MALELHLEGFSALVADDKGDILQSVQRALRVPSFACPQPAGGRTQPVPLAIS